MQAEAGADNEPSVANEVNPDEQSKAEQNAEPAVALRRTSRRTTKVQNYQEQHKKAVDEPIHLASNDDFTNKPPKRSKEPKKSQVKASKTAKFAEMEEMDLASLENTVDVASRQVVEEAVELPKQVTAKANKKKDKKGQDEEAAAPQAASAPSVLATTAEAATKNLIKRPKPKTKANLATFALSQLSLLTNLVKDCEAPLDSQVAKIKDVLHNLSADNYKVAMFLENKK